MGTREMYEYIAKWAEKQPEEYWTVTRIQNDPNTPDGWGYDERGFVKYSTQQVYEKFLQDMGERMRAGDKMALYVLNSVSKTKFSRAMAFNGYPTRHRIRNGKTIRCYIRVST